MCSRRPFRAGADRRARRVVHRRGRSRRKVVCKRADLTAEKVRSKIMPPTGSASRPTCTARAISPGCEQDGTIECLGRIDHQVKLRGYRIELGEIEAAMVRHPSVKEAVIVAHDRGSSGENELDRLCCQPSRPRADRRRTAKLPPGKSFLNTWFPSLFVILGRPTAHSQRQG